MGLLKELPANKWVATSRMEEGCFGLEVPDNSMFPVLIQGDVAIVVPQTDADSGDYVVIKIEGNPEAVAIRRLDISLACIKLVSLDLQEPAQFLPAEFDKSLIVGKVVQKVVNF